MSRSFIFATALACGLAVSACNSDSSPTAPADPPALRTANNPNGPGAFVVRFADAVGVLLSGPDLAYSVLAGLTRDQLAALCAGEDFTLDPATDQLVFRPDGSIHQVLRARDVNVFVFSGAFADFCAEPPFAVGTGNFINTDNDLLLSFNRTNSFGFRLLGNVTEPGGAQHHLLAKLHAVFLRSGLLRVTSLDIKLN